ncbi:MAG: NTP transferase domain-containing protein [Oscillospiraceae bacterium]|nr:NTP transferase domain-containing protein [Oscillospiraceae bacterium]
MKNTALILTGGDGLRLRPLTCSRSKAMLPVCGRPLIRFTLDLLKRQDIPAVIAADRFSNAFSDLPCEDIIVSDVPEGNCKAVSRAAEYASEGFLTVIYGGLLFDTDLNAAVKQHAESGAEVTLITRKTDRACGNVLAEVSGSKVTGIITDPSRESCLSDTALTGIFILSPQAVKKAADFTDLEGELIPHIIESGGMVQSLDAEGFFLGIDSLEDYFAANRAVLEGAYPHGGEGILRSADQAADIELAPPVYIAPTAKLAPRVKIGKGTVIGENVTVCRGAKLNGAVVMDGAYIGECVTVNHAVIGTGARLLSGAAVYEGAAVGDGAVIGSNAAVQSGVRIWYGKRLDSYSEAVQDVKYGFLSPVRIGDEGICGETGGVITPASAAALGSALVSLGGRIGVGHKDNAASRAFALAVATGISAAGGEAWVFGAVTEPALEYCTAISGLAAGCMVESGITTKLKLCSGDGLPLSAAEERLVENCLNRSGYRRAGFGDFGEIRDCSAVAALYGNMIEAAAPKRLTKIRAVLNTSGRLVTDLCEGILRRIDPKDAPPVVFHIGSGGKGVSAYTEETGYVFEEKLALICCRDRLSKGHDIAVPCNFPRAADIIAEEFGRKVLRYSSCPSGKGDGEARALAAETLFIRDGAALMLTVLGVLESRGMTLAEAVAELPQTAISGRYVALSAPPLRILRSIAAEKQVSGDGIVISDERGRVLIRPLKSEKGVLMQAESFNMETASELCDFYQDLILGIRNS